jgi:hypothetical protein
MTVADCNLTTRTQGWSPISSGLEGRCDEGDQRRQARSQGAEHASSAGSPESEQIRDAHGETREEHVAQRGYNDGSTGCLIAGPQDDQSDDCADAGEQVAEADAECPHAHVGDVVGLHVEESSHSWATEEEELEGCGCDVDHRADQGGGLGEAVHGVADVTRPWVLGRARIQTHPGRLNQDVAAGDDEAAYVEGVFCRLR